MITISTTTATRKIKILTIIAPSDQSDLGAAQASLSRPSTRGSPELQAPFVYADA
jgi:hypothetical protein